MFAPFRIGRGVVRSVSAFGRLTFALITTMFPYVMEDGFSNPADGRNEDAPSLSITQNRR